MAQVMRVASQYGHWPELLIVSGEGMCDGGIIHELTVKPLVLASVVFCVFFKYDIV